MKSAWMLFAFLSVFSFSAQATLTITSVGGANSYTLATTSGAATKVYAGYVIPDTAGGVTCPATTTDLCDTCQGGCSAQNICPCNRRGIHPNLNLTFTITSTMDLNGRYLVSKVNNTGDIVFQSAVLSSGTSATVSQTWGNICDKYGLGGNTCSTTGDTTKSFTFYLSKVGDPNTQEGSETVTATVVISIIDQTADFVYANCFGGSATTNEGLCYYRITKGDNKVYIKDEIGSLPEASSVSDIIYNKLVFFFSEGTGTAAGITNASSYFEVDVDSTGIFDGRIMSTDILNDVPYCFILGHQNTTGNIVWLEDPSGAGVDANVCATPEDVEGLLDGQECFIATAAFGSPLNPYVETLRKFRSLILSKYDWGQKFIKFYYKNSPPWAKKIEQNKTLKAVTQFALWPVVGLAALSLKIGFANSMLLILGFIVLFGSALYFRKKKVIGKIFIWLLFLPIFVTVLTYSSAAQAQEEIDDTEEGGPPQEAPFVQDPGLEEMLETPPEENIMGEEKKEEAPEKTTEKKIERPPVVPEPEIIRPPQEEIKPAYVVPKKPLTEKGKETGVELIPHPQSKKGLFQISEDGSYLYHPVEIEPQGKTYNVRIGQINPPPQIDGPLAGVTYESMYGDSFPVQVNFDYEWYPFRRFGRLGIQLGAGLFTSTGKGHFVSDGSEADETYTFYGVPLSLGLIYRLQIGSRPWIAPYIAGGGSYYGLLEMRDDDEQPKLIGTPAAYGAGGLLISLAAFDREISFTLANEYGVQNIWLSIEARQVQALNENLDVTATVFSGGVVMDF